MRFFNSKRLKSCFAPCSRSEGIPAGPTHNLRTLIDLLDADHAMKPEFLAVEEWSSAATRFRYPSGSGDAPNVSAAMLRERQSRLAALAAGCHGLHLGAKRMRTCRHDPKPIVNIADVPLRDGGNGEQFVAKLGRIGPMIGAQKARLPVARRAGGQEGVSAPRASRQRGNVLRRLRRGNLSASATRAFPSARAT